MQNPLMRIGLGLLSVLAGLASHVTANVPDPVPLAGTAPLEKSGDIASELVAAADRFLLDQLDQAAREPKERWHHDRTSSAAYEASIATGRTRLRHLLGLHDDRPRRRLCHWWLPPTIRHDLPAVITTNFTR